jgi:ankyrin repeat/BTB/POZ domain-containing protein 1
MKYQYHAGSISRSNNEAALHHILVLSLFPIEYLFISRYGVLKIREFCLDTIACNFEMFADTKDFRALLLTLPPPSGDSSLRTTVPSMPGSALNNDQGNLLDDLRDKWLEIEAAELDERDESALQFDKRLEMLMLVAEHEKSSGDADSNGVNDVKHLAFSPITPLISGEQKEP